MDNYNNSPLTMRVEQCYYVHNSNDRNILTQRQDSLHVNTLMTLLKSEGTAALPTSLNDWANLRTYLQPTTTVKRYAAIPSHLVNVRIALNTLEHSLPCYVISKPQVLGGGVGGVSTPHMKFVWVYKFYPTRFSGRTVFVSFASTSFIVFLKVRRLFHSRLQVYCFSGRKTFVSFQSTSFIVFLDYDMCFICA
jgi:hypothetical protein